MTDGTLVYCFDLDGTLCHTPEVDGIRRYEQAEPIPARIAHVNELADAGHTIVVDTSRGWSTGKDWYQFTRDQLDEWGLKYHLLMVGRKPGAAVYVDDKGIGAGAYFEDGL